MAVEGAVADPVVEVVKSADSQHTPDPASRPAASQPEPKWEDDPRVKGMLSDLAKERKTRQDHERAASAKDVELAEWRRKVEALTGVSKPSQEQADAQLVKGKIAELFPELADLGSIADIKKALEEQQVKGFAEHSNRILAKIHDGIAAEYGDLTDRQKRRINAAYLYENQTNPEFHARHNQGDPTLVTEFVKEMVEDLVDPIKKKTTASEAGRFRPVPGGRDRSSPMRGDKKIDPTDNKAVMDMLVKSRAGQFGRR